MVFDKNEYLIYASRSTIPNINKIREEQFFINTNVDVGDTTSNAGTVNGLTLATTPVGGITGAGSVNLGGTLTKITNEDTSAKKISF